MIQLRANDSSVSCKLTGFPKIYGRLASGAEQQLEFQESTTAAAADAPSDFVPGLLTSETAGGLYMTTQLNGCTKPKPDYRFLIIELNGRAAKPISMPSQLNETACYSQLSELGTDSELQKG